MTKTKPNTVDLLVRASRHIGAAYPVVQPKTTDEREHRGDARALTVVRASTVVRWDDGHPVLGIALNGQQVISLNPDTATALGLALIAEADGWREVVRED